MSAFPLAEPRSRTERMETLLRHQEAVQRRFAARPYAYRRLMPGWTEEADAVLLATMLLPFLTPFLRKVDK